MAPYEDKFQIDVMKRPAELPFRNVCALSTVILERNKADQQEQTRWWLLSTRRGARGRARLARTEVLHRACTRALGIIGVKRDRCKRSSVESASTSVPPMG